MMSYFKLSTDLKSSKNYIFFSITGKHVLLLLLLSLLLLLLLLPWLPAKRRPTTQTACHISRSTGTSPPVVQGLPMRADIPRSSADVSESCNITIFLGSGLFGYIQIKSNLSLSACSHGRKISKITCRPDGLLYIYCIPKVLIKIPKSNRLV